MWSLFLSYMDELFNLRECVVVQGCSSPSLGTYSPTPCLLSLNHVKQPREHQHTDLCMAGIFNLRLSFTSTHLLLSVNICLYVLFLFVIWLMRKTARIPRYSTYLVTRRTNVHAVTGEHRSMRIHWLNLSFILLLLSGLLRGQFFWFAHILPGNSSGCLLHVWLLRTKATHNPGHARTVASQSWTGGKWNSRKAGDRLTNVDDIHI